jgi:hypothetical protein
MMKIVKSLSLIAAVVAIAGGGTYASIYLNDVERVAGITATDAAMSYKIAEVEVGEVRGFPMNFTNMVPETEYSKPANIKYLGTTPGDLYFKATEIKGYADLSPFLQVRIDKVDGSGNLISHVTNWENALSLYSWRALDYDVAPNATVYYKVYAKVLGNNDLNTFQGQTAYNGVDIQAVQADGIPE